MQIQMMNTIDGTYKLCKEKNIGISKQFLTYLIKNNIIPGCKVGRKYLINWNGLMKYLEGFNVCNDISNDEVKLDIPRNKIRSIR